MIADTGPGLRYTVAEQLRILAVAGIPVGVVVVGGGSRLAMLALRISSSESVVGVESDDGFTIGKVTLSGTYNLFMLGAVVGIIGVATYQCVARRLIGPTWFRRLTVAMAAGAVGGSMLIHSDGVDFRLLTPTWFAIGLFVALPAVFGAAVGPVVDRVMRPSAPAASGRTRWILPIALAVAFPVALVVLVIAAIVFTTWVLVRDAWVRRVSRGRVVNVLIQACWLGVAALGLVALVGDVRALT